VTRKGQLVRLRPDGHGIDVHPIKFHDELERAFQRYLAILRTPAEAVRRENFWKKMDHIARKKSSAVDVD